MKKHEGGAGVDVANLNDQLEEVVGSMLYGLVVYVIHSGVECPQDVSRPGITKHIVEEKQCLHNTPRAPPVIRLF